MIKHSLAGTAIFFLFLILMAGCSDDECTTCPPPLQKPLVDAILAIENNNLIVSGDIYGLGSALEEVDSVTVAGYKIDLIRSFYGGTNSLDLSSDHITPEISSGDTLEMVIYSSFGQSRGEVAVLDLNYDQADVVNWNTIGPPDTIQPYEPLEIIWNKSDAVEWYWIMANYSDGSTTIRENHITTDTSLSLSSDFTLRDGINFFIIISGTGPRPNDNSTNVTGSFGQGVVYSQTLIYFYVVVGEGIPDNNNSLILDFDPEMAARCYPGNRFETQLKQWEVR